MPWPTDPASEFFGRGLWGWATNVWERIKGDGSGALHVHIASQTGTQLIQQTMPTLLKPGIHGYDGAAWQKLALLYGYSDRVAERVTDLAPGAVNKTVVWATVPAGSIYEVTNLVMYNATGTTARMELFVSNGVFNMPLAYVLTAIALQNLFWQGRILLKAGDYIYGSWTTIAVTDDLYISGWGREQEVS